MGGKKVMNIDKKQPSQTGKRSGTSACVCLNFKNRDKLYKLQSDQYEPVWLHPYSAGPVPPTVPNSFFFFSFFSDFHIDAQGSQRARLHCQAKYISDAIIFPRSLNAAQSPEQDKNTKTVNTNPPAAGIRFHTRARTHTHTHTHSAIWPNTCCNLLNCSHLPTCLSPLNCLSVAPCKESDFLATIWCVRLHACT